MEHDAAAVECDLLGHAMTADHLRVEVRPVLGMALQVHVRGQLRRFALRRRVFDAGEQACLHSLSLVGE
jgi:hypothetical protein